VLRRSLELASLGNSVATYGQFSWPLTCFKVFSHLNGETISRRGCEDHQFNTVADSSVRAYLGYLWHTRLREKAACPRLEGSRFPSLKFTLFLFPTQALMLHRAGCVRAEV
jgi:hypothetical protein